ncbi:hypothetical protein [Brevibacillus thermoruber]|uniref:hypothetical protein n=1 Tax=Brevibacillus thermoruber TaxID=33942 RepID=UPI000555B444|nr:hypothetical protein [Brevibacillus thermoruber]
MDTAQLLAAHGIGAQSKLRVGDKIPVASIGDLTDLLTCKISVNSGGGTVAMSPTKSGLFVNAQDPGTTIGVYRADGTLRNNITGPSGTKRLAMDTQENVYCGVGTTLKKFSVDGAELWSKTLSSNVLDVKFSKDCIYVHYGTTNGTGRLAKFDLAGNLIWDVQSPSSGAIGTIGVDANGQLYFSNQLYIYKIDKATGVVSSTLTITISGSWGSGLWIDPTGAYLGVNYYNNSYHMKIWKTSDWSVVSDTQPMVNNNISGACITPNQQVAILQNQSVRLYPFGSVNYTRTYGSGSTNQLYSDFYGNLLLSDGGFWWRYDRYYSILR